MEEKPAADSGKGQATPGFKLPDVARVARPAPAEARWKEAPILAANAEVRTDARLRDFADGMRAGVKAKLRAARSEESGTSGRGLVQCLHYLPVNRFEWWDWWHTNRNGERMPNGPLTILEGTPNAQESVEVEFCSTLSTVVGTDLGELQRVVGRKLPWDSLPEDVSPNETPGLEFSIRQNRPASVPVMRELQVDVGGRMVRRKVLVHGVEEGHELDPALPRPSLFFDFVAAQRSVGIEYGFLSDDRAREIVARLARLIAYDRDGAIVGESDGSVTGVDDLSSNFVRNIIGVRDREGRIRTAELRFGDADNPIPEPQLVYRIWHEALPPAAVHQGSVEEVWHGAGHPENRHQEVEETLPFRCDRHMLMLRGFKLEWLDRPHSLRGMDALVRERTSSGVAGDGTVRVTVTGTGSLHTGDTPDIPPFRAKVFYTILAWDSEQVELFSTEPTLLASRSEVPATDAWQEMPDPCPISLPPFGDLCGALFGAMQFWDCDVFDNQALDKLDLVLDYPVRTFRTERQPPDRDSEPDRDPPPRGRQVLPFSAVSTGFRVLWRMYGEITGSGEGPNRWRMLARMMTGASVVVPFRDLGGVAATIGEFPPRADGEYQYGPNRRYGTGAYFSGVVDADMAFVELESIFMEELDGRARHVDTELLGDFYDGHQLDCSWGLGSSRREVGSDETFRMLTLPRFGGLVRAARSLRPRFAQQALRFERGIVGFLTLAPDQFGAVRNVGPIPVLINRAEKAGPHPDDFQIRLEHHGDVFHLSELPNRAPLELRPGQTLVVGGQFFPQAEAGPNERPREAWIELFTNDPNESQITVFAFGHTTRSDAIGSWAPAQINFGFVPVTTGTFRTRNALLMSSGQTPLVVQSLALQDESLGFGWGILQASPSTSGEIGAMAQFQIDPGDAMTIQISYRPIGVGFVQTVLVAETNAGRLEFRLYGEGVNG